MATPEPDRQRRASLSRGQDTLSPVWPDRLIRPLPKNRLRSKLSPEQQGSIIYPPNPPQSSPLFTFPYGISEAQDGTSRERANGHRHSSPTHCDCGGHHLDHSDGEEAGYDHPTYRWSSPGPAVENLQQRYMPVVKNGGVPNGAGGRNVPPAPASTTSSADGYESFENTSNKKKRKIPLSSGSSVHQSSLSADLANMGISSPAGASDGGDQVNGQYHSPSGTGISGAGRGRYGRHGGKQERRVGRNGMVDGTYVSSLAPNRGGDYTGDGIRLPNNGDQGIISTAIANAAGQTPTTPPKGKENVSLLSQEAEKSVTPKSQFTFTCETDTSSKIVWPLQGSGSGEYNQPSKKNYYPIRQRPADPVNMNHGTQTTPSLRPAPDPRMAAPAPPPLQNAQPPMNGQPPPPKPRRRRPSKEFAMAARQRRLAQDFNNFQHKPTKDSMWICEFCEYEDLFGRPPVALIRQYEVKDRAERKKAEERRRLLDKAKMKKNKGKNKGKGGKNANNPPPANPGPGYDPAMDNAHMPPDMQGDEYYDDEYDDGYDPVDPNDPAYAQDYQYPPHPPDHVHGPGVHGQVAHPAPAA